MHSTLTVYWDHRDRNLDGWAFRLEKRDQHGRVVESLSGRLGSDDPHASDSLLFELGRAEAASYGHRTADVTIEREGIADAAC